MDEQLFRARLAALEMAHMQYGFTTDGYTDAVLSVAAEFEAWLTRPTPVDAIMDKAMSVHAAETTADRTGYPRCPTGWKNTADPQRPHVCRWAPGHTVDHECACGAVLDTP